MPEPVVLLAREVFSSSDRTIRRTPELSSQGLLRPGSDEPENDSQCRTRPFRDVSSAVWGFQELAREETARFKQTSATCILPSGRTESESGVTALACPPTNGDADLL